MRFSRAKQIGISFGFLCRYHVRSFGDIRHGMRYIDKKIFLSWKSKKYYGKSMILRRNICGNSVVTSLPSLIMHRNFTTNNGNNDDSKGKPNEIPINERPDWVLIGVKDCSRVFRLNESHLENVPHLKKLDAYDDKKEVRWFYMRDVWQKSCEIHGTELVNKWYNDYVNEVKNKVTYDSIYGWKHKKSLPKENPLIRWIISNTDENISTDNVNKNQNLQWWQILPQHIYNDDSSSSNVVKRAIMANSIKFGLTLGLFAYTGSETLHAETWHALGDTTNQLLLLLSIGLSRASPDWRHPYGYSARRWLGSFVSGAVVFWMGGKAFASAVYNFVEPDVPINLMYGVILCGSAAILETYSFLGAWREIKEHISKQQMTFSQYLANGSDSTSIHVFLEDTTGLFCSIVAVGSLTLAHSIHPIFDSFGGVIIGSSLMFVGSLLITRNAKLLSGRSLQSPILKEVVKILDNYDVIHSHHDIKSLIVGQNRVVIKLEVNFNADKIAEKYVQTSKIFPSFQNACEKHDMITFHDLLMRSSADYQQWMIRERTNLEILIMQKVKDFGFDIVHVDIENY